MNVLVLQKRLTVTPTIQPCDGVTLRHYRDGDVDAWLKLQAVAMPSSRAGRKWTERDFAREFLAREWWSPERMLFAVSQTNEVVRTEVVGTVTLGECTSAGVCRSSMQWLLVMPDCQRNGIGTFLVSKLEQMCWNTGRRSILLETLATWSAAAFYRSRGYEPS